MRVFKYLTPIDNFAESFAQNHFIKVDDQHSIIITDVVGSTRAIAEGRYKEVNIAGALSVIALTNAFKDMEFPFVFGGDGVTFIVENQDLDRIQDILIDTRDKVKFMYDLDLRIGIVPLKVLNETSNFIFLAKLKVSPHYLQAILQGEGVDYAEKLIKQKDSQFLVQEKVDPSIEADFSGFTCRWQDIPSQHGETVALIVKIGPQKANEVEKYFADFTRRLNEIIGSEERHHPVAVENLKTASAKQTINEAMATTGKKGRWANLLVLGKIRFEILASKFFMALKIPVKHGYYNLSKLRHYNRISSDYKKFDGTLKMVVAVDPRQREKLTDFLEQEYRQRNIYYGIHISDRALITCLLHSNSEKEVHFIDAADGGYALAAKNLKLQLAQEI